MYESYRGVQNIILNSFAYTVLALLLYWVIWHCFSRQNTFLKFHHHIDAPLQLFKVVSWLSRGWLFRQKYEYDMNANCVEYHTFILQRQYYVATWRLNCATADCRLTCCGHWPTLWLVSLMWSLRHILLSLPEHGSLSSVTRHVGWGKCKIVFIWVNSSLCNPCRFCEVQMVRGEPWMNSTLLFTPFHKYLLISLFTSQVTQRCLGGILRSCPHQIHA